MYHAALLNLKSYPYFVHGSTKPKLNKKNSIQAFELQQVIGMWLPYESTIEFFYLSLLLTICPFDLVLSSKHLHCKNRMYLNIYFEVRNYQIFY